MGGSQINPTAHEVSLNVDSAAHHLGKGTAHHDPPRHRPLAAFFWLRPPHPDQLSIMCCHHPCAASFAALITLPGKMPVKMYFPWKHRRLCHLTPSSSPSWPQARYLKANLTAGLYRLMVMGLGPQPAPAAPSRRETQLIFFEGRVGAPGLCRAPFAAMLRASWVPQPPRMRDLVAELCSALNLWGFRGGGKVPRARSCCSRGCCSGKLLG